MSVYVNGKVIDLDHATRPPVHKAYAPPPPLDEVFGDEEEGAVADEAVASTPKKARRKKG